MAKDSDTEATLKVLVLNAENLFIFLEHWKDEPFAQMTEIQWQKLNSGLIGNKTLSKVQALAATISKISPDLIMLTEVGGMLSLENFNRFFLNDAFQPFLLEGNSDRGIDMGFLLRAPWSGKIYSHKEYKLPHPKYTTFSRDVLKLEVSLNQQLVANALLVHLKSKLNSKGDDFEGRTRRAVEVLGLSEIIYQLPTEVPLILGGDFNGVASGPSPEPEFAPLAHKNNLQDAALVAGLPESERFSYVYFNNGGQRIEQQLDYLFLNKKAQESLVKESVTFPRYTGSEGQLIPLPQRSWQKVLMPSDHLPLYAEFKLKIGPAKT